MIPSKNCIEQIKHFELLRLKAYLCPAGIPTIGYGCTQYENGTKIKLGEVITEKRAEELLSFEVAEKAKGVNALVKVQLMQGQFDSLVDFAFNLGVYALKGSTLLKKLNVNPNDVTIPAEFAKWVMAFNPKTGKKEPMPGLIRRRKSEAHLYTTGKLNFFL